jgi:glycosyltransferase involved in cell wall biosynthesis
MIKILGLALYGPLAASHRYRLGQFVPGLAKMGIDLQIRHLLCDEYLHARFNGQALPLRSMMKDGMSRFKDLWNQDIFDAVMLQCELMPLMPGWLEQALIRKPYIYDFDDAFYLKYRTGKMSWAKPLLGSKFDGVIGEAAAITAGNYGLADYANRFNGNTHYLPTVVDTDRYLPMKGKRDSEVFTVGWIGSPSTAPYLQELIEPLSDLGKEGAVRLIVVGGKVPKIPNVSVVQHQWHEHTELELINTFDVGVMPLPNDEWARGKCAFKLIQYMACAVPVIASPVGANVDVVNKESGVLATNAQEWLEAFRLLRDKPAIRMNMGEAGRARVVQHYSLQQNLPKLAGVIHQVLGDA